MVVVDGVGAGLRQSVDGHYESAQEVEVVVALAAPVEGAGIVCRVEDNGAVGIADVEGCTAIGVAGASVLRHVEGVLSLRRVVGCRANIPAVGLAGAVQYPLAACKRIFKVAEVGQCRYRTAGQGVEDACGDEARVAFAAHCGNLECVFCVEIQV